MGSAERDMRGSRAESLIRCNRILRTVGGSGESGSAGLSFFCARYLSVGTVVKTISYWILYELVAALILSASITSGSVVMPSSARK